MSYNVTLVIPDPRPGRPELHFPVRRPADHYPEGSIVVEREDVFDAGGTAYKITGPGVYDSATRTLSYPAVQLSVSEVPPGMLKLYRRR